jgi:hypothetical protein
LVAEQVRFIQNFRQLVSHAFHRDVSRWRCEPVSVQRGLEVRDAVTAIAGELHFLVADRRNASEGTVEIPRQSIADRVKLNADAVDPPWHPDTIKIAPEGRREEAARCNGKEGSPIKRVTAAILFYN